MFENLYTLKDLSSKEDFENAYQFALSLIIKDNKEALLAEEMAVNNEFIDTSRSSKMIEQYESNLCILSLEDISNIQYLEQIQYDMLISDTIVKVDSYEHTVDILGSDDFFQYYNINGENGVDYVIRLNHDKTLPEYYTMILKVMYDSDGKRDFKFSVNGSVYEINTFDVYEYYNYEEYNNYYYELYNSSKYLDSKGEMIKINPYVARTSEDYTLLGYDENILTEHQTILFIDLYEKIRFMFFKVLYNRAFEDNPMYRSYIRMFLIFITMEKFLTQKATDVTNINMYDDSMIKNMLISYGLSELVDGSLFASKNEYQIKILQHFTEFTQYKGSKKILELIIKLFDFADGLEIKKYVVGKLVDSVSKDSTPMVYEMDYDDSNFLDQVTKANPMDFDSFHQNDAYNTLNSESVNTLNFNTTTLKYISLIGRSNIKRSKLILSYMNSVIESIYDRQQTLLIDGENVNILDSIKLGLDF